MKKEEKASYVVFFSLSIVFVHYKKGLQLKRENQPNVVCKDDSM